MTSFVRDSADQALHLLNEVQAATDAFAASSGIKCREGCGQCCLKPGIEVQVVEMLPLARSLLAEPEKAATYYDRAASVPDGRCVFYTPNPADESLGRCSQYALRPSLCRLFGFAAVSTKDSKHPALASCHWHKTLQPEAVAAAQVAIDNGAPVPLMSDYSMRLRMLAPSPSDSARLPINRALMDAIEKLSLAAPASSGEER